MLSKFIAWLITNTEQCSPLSRMFITPPPPRMFPSPYSHGYVMLVLPAQCIVMLTVYMWNTCVSYAMRIRDRRFSPDVMCYAVSRCGSHPPPNPPPPTHSYVQLLYVTCKAACVLRGATSGAERFSTRACSLLLLEWAPLSLLVHTVMAFT